MKRNALTIRDEHENWVREIESEAFARMAKQDANARRVALALRSTATKQDRR